MPPIFNLPHLKIEGHSTDVNYNYPKTVVVPFRVAVRNRAIHGARIKEQLSQIQERFEQLRAEDLPDGIIHEDAIYVEFYSEWDFGLSFSSLHNEARRPKYQILKIVEESTANDEHQRYRVLVMLKEGGISHFIKAVDEYLNAEKDVSKKDQDGNVVATNPKNNKLIANITAIQLATIQEFWTDAPQYPFPDLDEVRWWEVWFRKSADEEARLVQITQNLNAVGAQLGQSVINFREHTVRLVKATARQLSRSLVLLDNLAELRKPQETADCFSREGIRGRDNWINELLQRTEVAVDDDSTLICLLDSGVNHHHALISPFLPDHRLYAYNNAWGTHDTWGSEGHGTGMAALALYGDLTDALDSRNSIVIRHGLESFKVKQYGVENDPELYGAITQMAVDLPVIIDGQRRRVFCLSITDAATVFRGRPSSWSSTIDKLCFGNSELAAEQQLFIISGGNVSTAKHADYYSLNDTTSVHDPAQAYNAISVGSYTSMDRFDPRERPGWRILAARGAMAPSNSTSLLFESQWPNKPDIVMEGGNMITDGADIAHHPTLQMLTASKRHLDQQFQLFGDTSGAAALTAKMAAEIWTAYPNLWPETIRALIIHSAQYTGEMTGGFDPAEMTSTQKRNLLRRFGYGVPNLERALYSASNALNLIMERTIQPYHQYANDTPTYNNYHLYQLPWPAEVLLEELANRNVTLTITLSYFIDPNPGARIYKNNFQYHSHSLDFSIIKPAEDLEDFKKRISKAEEEEETEEVVKRPGEIWSLKQARSRGSLKKDFITISGADLSTRNVIAIYPRSGWYKTRKKLGLASQSVRYSLIVSIESDQLTSDIYVPVMNQIAIPN
ncbi:hypothetical protein PBAL39_15779 [Pedobacter sp. BAL39]|uniref:S8 family peptidase n=1 Tax=Pedobacter sp. BAL39 TaxID=391596 RepID=UPI000155A0C6|nr:S8 family peptidase [Pedobacter sp. BAL39]EDM37899.1 hypothetical protein PBAL39_15779 [Pedobacter sp. BAL39]